MKRRTFLTGTGAAIIGLPFLANRALADDKVIRFAMPQDFTRVYTFVTVEYSQGQRDYISLINAKGGINGYQNAPRRKARSWSTRCRRRLRAP